MALTAAWALGILSNVGKLFFISIFRTFRRSSSPCRSWRSSSISDSDRAGVAGPFRGGFGRSSSCLLILSGRAALDQLIDGLSQATLVRKTSLPTSPKLITRRRALESGRPESRISMEVAYFDIIDVGEFLTDLNVATSG